MFTDILDWMANMKNRLGLHYFQDINHYLTKDLNLWLSEFELMKIEWLVLESSVKFAIPEEFIRGLIKKGVKPIIHFNFPISSIIKPDDLKIILNAYAKWGVKYVLFYNAPNLKSSWAEGTWSQENLVDRFLDRYLPFVKLADQSGLTPIFPPLQPGGDYWDISFLKKVLASVKQRKAIEFLTDLHLAVSGQTFLHPIDYGKGGSSKWQSSKPYIESKTNQSHIGFNTWEWYLEIVQEQLNATPKVLLFWYGAGDVLQNKLDPNVDLETVIKLTEISTDFTPGENLPDHIIACNLWILGSEGKPMSHEINIEPQHEKSLLEKIKSLRIKWKKDTNPTDYNLSKKVADWIYPIDHYLLLPKYDWGISEHILEKVRPIIQDSKPTLGFSLLEASNARKVTVWNENYAFKDNDLKILHDAGCEVEELQISGINLAI